MTLDRKRFLFVTPDSNVAAGGIRQIYRFVDVLTEAGGDAAVVHSRPDRWCSWFPNETKVLSANAIALTPRDVVIVPEIWAPFAHTVAPGTTKVLFVQNPFLALDACRSGHAFREAYTHPDVDAVLATSAHCARVLSGALPSASVHTLRYGIDAAQFRPAPNKERLIAYMPRKRAADVRTVLSLLEVSGALEGWTLVPIDGLPEAAVAEVLARASVFLSFSHNEGLGLPPAEAMAAECVVVGFDGFGGRELFDLGATRIEDGDVFTYASTVAALLASINTALAEAQRTATRVRATYAIAEQARIAVDVFRHLAGLPMGAQPVSTASLLPLWPTHRRRLNRVVRHLRAADFSGALHALAGARRTDSAH